MPPQGSEPGVGLSEDVDEISMDGSGSHAAIHKSPDLFLGSFLNSVPYFKGSEKVQCSILKWVRSTGTFLRKGAHHLLAQPGSLLLASDALVDHLLHCPPTLHNPGLSFSVQQCGSNPFMIRFVSFPSKQGPQPLLEWD